MAFVEPIISNGFYLVIVLLILLLHRQYPFIPRKYIPYIILYNLENHL
jgi:hypothetical protein